MRWKTVLPQTSGPDRKRSVAGKMIQQQRQRRYRLTTDGSDGGDRRTERFADRGVDALLGHRRHLLSSVLRPRRRPLDVRRSELAPASPSLTTAETGFDLAASHS